MGLVSCCWGGATVASLLQSFYPMAGDMVLNPALIWRSGAVRGGSAARVDHRAAQTKRGRKKTGASPLWRSALRKLCNRQGVS